MTYLNAIAIAGGFTYRAKQDRAYVISGVDTSQEERQVKLEKLVQPGDIIRIDERCFNLTVNSTPCTVIDAG